MANSGNQDKTNHDDLTDYGQGIGWSFGGIFFLLCAWYLNPLPTVEFLGVDLYFERAANILFYVFAGVCFLLSFGFFTRAPGNHPGLGRFLKSLAGGGDEGWRYAFLTTFAAGVAASFYGLSRLIPEEPWWLAWIAGVLMMFALIASFFIVALLAFAIDSFFIKPAIRSASADQTTFDAHVERFRRRATVVIPIVIALVTLIVELLR